MKSLYSTLGGWSRLRTSLVLSSEVISFDHQEHQFLLGGIKPSVGICKNTSSSDISYQSSLAGLPS